MTMRKRPTRSRFILPAAAVAACICLLLIIPYSADPTLYSIEQDAETPLHDRVTVLRQISRDSTGVALPLMEEIFADSGTLVLNLNLKDFSSAERDLEHYLARTREFDNLVIRLDMSQSDLDEWRQLNAQNKDALLTLFEDTERFSELARLEIEYRDADDPDMLYSIMYEGEALRSKIRETVAAYEARSEEMIRVSEHFEVDTTSYTHSVDDAQQIAADVDTEQEKRSETIRREIPPAAPMQVSLGVEPFEVWYGDTLTLSGMVRGTNNRVVSVYLDGRLFKEVTAAEDGAFVHRETIGRIRSGMHTVYATIDGAFSDVQHFRVFRSKTAITLENPGAQMVTGRLVAGEAADIPVSGAPIRIIYPYYNWHMVTTSTDADGRFSFDLEDYLWIGEHQIAAVFDDTAFPLEEASSDAVTITVLPEERRLLPFPDPGTETGEGYPLASILLAAVIILIASAGGIWYLRRRPGGAVLPAAPKIEAPADDPDQLQDDEMPPEPDDPDQPQDDEMPPEPDDLASGSPEGDPGLAAYWQLADIDYPSALRYLFHSLAHKAGLDDPSTKTTGDLRQLIPEDERLMIWLSAYDRVLYGGAVPDRTGRAWFEDEYRALRGDLR
ncbi:MAG: hypothetical protein D5R96_04275 [Methanocalculus sp. MSAO_Arc2]|uniref:hypothetical protein n=1 Tax=Methanocalculus sp. MSAO_Arc2 TaxID=2293855 RepID=UPI000FF5E4DA|nr:MAG: hypothetical protein D5R96_04275 [Methanocalculus sp. MSAO_Arc2]